MEQWDHVDRAIGLLADDSYQLLSTLVRIKTTRFQERAAQDVMAAAFRRLGCDVDVFEPNVDEIKHLRGYSPVECDYAGRPDVVGRLAGRGGGKSLVFNGHIDVVSEAPLERWSVDPYAAVVRDGKMFGRGAFDMKAGLVAMVWAVAALRRAGVQAAGDLVLQSVIEEECGGNGTLAACARGHVGDAAVVCESSALPGPPTACRAAMGVQWARIRVPGHASHAGYASLGVNAIEKAYVVLQAVRELEAQRNRSRHPLYADLPRPAFCNVGIIQGGDWTSNVPGECTLEVRFGVFPGRSLDDAHREFDEVLRRVIRDRGDEWLAQHPPVVEWVGFEGEGVVFDPDTAFGRALSAAHRDVCGQPLHYRIDTAGNDMRFFNLYYGVPSTMYGALGAGAHAVDEYVELESIRQTAKVYTRLIDRWCGLVA